MNFDHSKIFVTKFALKFTEFQMFQPSARRLAFGCIPLVTQGEAKGEKPSAFGRPLITSIKEQGGGGKPGSIHELCT